MMQGFGPGFAMLYTAFAETPELAKFHRPIELWSWILNNEAAIIERKIKACNDVIAERGGTASENYVYRVTDYHCVYDPEGHTMLKSMMDDLAELVRQYSRPSLYPDEILLLTLMDIGKDLKLASEIANLPEQDEVFARHFAEYKNLFLNGAYGPTDQDANIYRQVPPHSATCCLKGHEEEDSGTKLLLRNIEPINESLDKLVHWIMRKPKRPRNSPLPRYVNFGTVRKAMHFLAGLYVALLLTGTLGILSSLSKEKYRIVTLGCLTLALMCSLILLIPSLKRNDLFSIAAAYFAVGGIYIGAKNSGCN
jgi:hypothetical protein